MPQKDDSRGRRVRAMSPGKATFSGLFYFKLIKVLRCIDSPELARAIKRPRGDLAAIMEYDSSPLAPPNNEAMSVATSVAAALKGPPHASREGLQKAHDAFKACKSLPSFIWSKLELTYSFSSACQTKHREQ